MASSRRRPLPDVEGVRLERGVGPAREEGEAASAGGSEAVAAAPAPSPAAEAPAPAPAQAPPPAPAASAPPAEAAPEPVKAPVPAAPAAPPAATTGAPAELPGQLVPELAARIPEPYTRNSSNPDLAPEQEAQLHACERGIDLGRGTWPLVGKALQTLRDARLYARTHGTFETYCRDRFDGELTSRRVNQLIASWRLGLAIAGLNGTVPPERQVRELLDYADRNGEVATVRVYDAVARHAGGVTAAALRQVLSALPAQHDPATIDEQVRAILTSGEPRVLPAPGRDGPIGLLGREVERLGRFERQAVQVAKRDPDGAREFAVRLRTLADTVERAAGGTT